MTFSVEKLETLSREALIELVLALTKEVTELRAELDQFKRGADTRV